MPEPLTGRLLVASPRLQDPNFERTVVLLLDHGEDGALGVVLNRPTGAEVEEILEPWAAQAAAAPPALVFSGGPVSPDAVIGLARPVAPDPPAGWRRVVGTVGAVDLAVPPEQQPTRLAGARLFAGYAGWAPGQLESELEERAWFVVAAHPGDVFWSSPGDLWHDVLRRQRGGLRLLAAYPPHPSVN